MDSSKRSVVAALAAGAALAALAGCGREESVASKSAAAFREAQARGETFGGDGHAHGHGTAGAGAGEDAAAHEHAGPAVAPTTEQGAEGHTAMVHGGPAADARERGAHAAHDGAARQAPPPASAPPAAGHTGHPPAAGSAPPPAAGRGVAPPAAAAVPPGQPGATLRPDPLDAPAPTSLIDARRAAEIAAEMAGGGHGAHGAGTYRQSDAGRGPEAYQEHAPAPSEPQPQHPHGQATPPAPPPEPPPKTEQHEHNPPGSEDVTRGAAPGERRQA